MAESPDTPSTNQDQLTVPSCLLASFALFIFAIVAFSGWYIFVKMDDRWLAVIYSASLGLIILSVVTIVQTVRGSLCFAHSRAPSSFYWLFLIVCLLVGLLLLLLSLRMVWQALAM